jgi:hypothetical protein
MDNRVQVALIEKARRIFTLSADTFLSFPLLSPVTFKPAVLTAILSPQSPSDYTQAADFARVANFVPRDMVAAPDSETLLWDVYDNVLDRGEAALGQNDPAAEARLKAAQALLFDSADDGRRTETQIYSDYRRYRDAWIVAQENYGAQRLTAEFSSDEAIKKQWTEVTEPKLSLLVAEARSDWETLGHKSEVEAALAEQSNAAARVPVTRWKDWRAQFNPDTDLFHSGPQSFAPTGFSPTDVSTSSSWLHTTLEADEIAALVAGAPPELHADGTSEIERVEFDFRSVAITRPWFEPEALTSRIWRLPSEDQILSDGADPPGGRLPAYVSAMVLVKNVIATMKAADQGKRTLPLNFTLHAAALTRRDLAFGTARLLKVRAASEIPADAAPPPVSETAAFAKLRKSSFKASDVRPIGAGLTIMRASAVRAEPGERFVSRGLRTGGPGRGRWLRDLVDIRGAGSATVETAQPDPPPPPPEPVPDDTISVLAFVCKRLPKTPDPLPELVWS